MSLDNDYDFYAVLTDEEEEPELSDKPWRDGRKKSRKKRRRFDSDEWEETQKARAKYLREWEEDLRYAEELANESM